MDTGDPFPGIEYRPDLLIPARGEDLAATRYRPAGADGPHPVVLIATPYRKDDRIVFGSWAPSVEYLAGHGYAVVVVDLPGTGASTGEPTPFSAVEGEYLAAAIDWLAARPWATDRVGMYGLSYGAWTQYATAAADPEPLAAIVPVAVSPDGYESSYTGGVFDPLKRAAWAVQLRASRALPPSRRDPEGRWAELWGSRLDALETDRPWLFRFRDHTRRDGFWDERSIPPEAITVPTLAACGYRDVHTRPMVEFIDAIDAPKRLILGPWRHRMPEQGRETAIDFRRQAVAWFDRYLKGQDTPGSDRPPVAYWTERDGGWRVGGGTWRGTDTWPTVARSPTVEYALAPAGLAPVGRADGDVERTYGYDQTVGMESQDRVGSATNTGVATNVDDARSVTFETPPLQNAVELTGSGEASLRVRATTPGPVVAARVVDVAPDGWARLVTVGYRRANHRDDHRSTDPLGADQETAVTIPLKPKSHVFETGHRVRLAIAAAHFPRTWPPTEQGELTLVSRPDARSMLRFPGEIHEDAPVTFDDTVSMQGPDTSVPRRSPFVTNEDGWWETGRNHGTDEARFATGREYTVALPHEATLSWSSSVGATVVANDPTAATFATDVELELAYPTERVHVESSAVLSQALTSLSTRVLVDGERVFEEAWRR